MNIIRRCIFSGFLLLPGFAFSQQTTEMQNMMTLQKCIERALEANYSIKIVRNEEAMVRNDVNLSPFLPTVFADLQQSQHVNDSKTITNGENRYTDDAQTNALSAGLGVTWRLFDGLAMFTNYDKVKELLAIGELNTQMAIEELIVNVSTAYYGVIVQHSQLDAAKHSLLLSQERFNEAKDKYMLGMVSGLDMQQSKLDLNADSSRYMKQRELLKSTYITLNMIMNSELQGMMYVNDSITLLEPMTLQELKRNAQELNTFLQVARKQQVISDMDVKLARSAFIPTLDFNGGYNLSRTKTPEAVTTYSRSNGFYWGVTLSATIFDRLENKRKMKDAKLKQEQTLWSYLDVELQIMADLAQLYNTYENNLQIVNFEKESADVAAENLDAALEKYKLGSLSGIEFREFQRSYIDAIDRKLSAIYQAKVSELELLFVSGQILK